MVHSGSVPWHELASLLRSGATVRFDLRTIEVEDEELELIVVTADYPATDTDPARRAIQPMSIDALIDPGTLARALETLGPTLAHPRQED